MKLIEAVQRFLNRDCVVTTREDEYCGILTEIGEDYICLIDGESDCLINTAFVESISSD